VLEIVNNRCATNTPSVPRGGNKVTTEREQKGRLFLVEGTKGVFVARYKLVAQSVVQVYSTVNTEE